MNGGNVTGLAVRHWSDCATNSEPAFPPGPCNCGAEETTLDEIREGIAEGWLVPATRADCVVCDDLGCEFCPHVRRAE